MTRTTMLVLAITAATFAATTTIALVMPYHHAGGAAVGTIQLTGNACHELAGDPLDNAREGDGTFYGYRV